MSSSDHRGVPQGNAAIIAAIIGAIALVAATALGIFVGRNSDTGQTSREVTRIITATTVAEVTNGVQATYAPYPEQSTAQAPTSAIGTPLEKMPIIEGTWTYKPDTVIRGEKYPEAIFLTGGRIVIRLLQKYQTMRMQISVDDKAGLGGFKHFAIRDHKGIVLFEGDAKPVLEPLAVEVDISRAEYVEINVNDFNGQPGEYIRLIDVRFYPKK